MNKEDLPDASEASGHASREHQHNDHLNETELEGFLEKLSLKENYKEKLSLSNVLEIDRKAVTEEAAKCLSDLPWCFLKKLMMVNATARNVKLSAGSESEQDHSHANAANLDFYTMMKDEKSGEELNPLDIITALFLCSNGLLQQEMAVKMSMCQFGVPLLLPDCGTKEHKLMLWALRGIVKKYRPQKLSDTQSYIEKSIVVPELPMVSFVRLGEGSLSKSEILNKFLSSPQQCENIFVHSNMECGNVPREIANGLVETSWYLPCGDKSIDIFNEPVAVANLRGDISLCELQYSFLCKTSAAVFVFIDNFDNQYELLKRKHETEIFLIVNEDSRNFNRKKCQKVVEELELKENFILKRKKVNIAEFAKTLQGIVTNVVNHTDKKKSIEQMADIAIKLGIKVDERASDCQNAEKKAAAITSNIKNTALYKEQELPRQCSIWKELTKIEKEECRLQNAKNENIKEYKHGLIQQKKNLLRKQRDLAISNDMISFIDAISCRPEQAYFLKWMQIKLDNLSHEHLSSLREQYKLKIKDSSKEELKDIDQQLSDSSLGIENYFREMIQIYESAVSLPESKLFLQYKHLPEICAQLLIDGFPLELVEGEALSIPLTWVKSVLSELKKKVDPESKIRIVTVLGIQSTGKSTLLNTMFGVQFAVSSGRCTRGAFMLLIKVNKEYSKEMNCDFLIIIDTEGLKSMELAQLADSYEHDNELATIVVGLSDITIVNIAMENMTDMKDILQIVVHAFLRMKEVGKKIKCQFVHQNMADVSAHDNNLRDRNRLLQQLNEMTQAAANVEGKEGKLFMDVMEYDLDTGNAYIPGLWHGSPPMAPVSSAYSQKVFELKINIIQMLKDSQSAAFTMDGFLKWTSDLWNAIKEENFIFSFRNSLVADAYMKICTEFNKWEWEFKKDMYKLLKSAKTQISNFGTAAGSEASNLGRLVDQLKTEASSKLDNWENKLNDNLEKYFKKGEGNVKLIEKYKTEFKMSAHFLRKEMNRSFTGEVDIAADTKTGMAKAEEVKENTTNCLEGEVLRLLRQSSHKSENKKSDEDLRKEFDNMWEKATEPLRELVMHETDVYTKVHSQLRTNVSSTGVLASDINDASLKEHGKSDFKVNCSGWVNFKRKMGLNDDVELLQAKADTINARCKKLVSENKQEKTDYHDNYIQEILQRIDAELVDMKTTPQFVMSLKLHICSYAAREFEKMHQDFKMKNDPFNCVNQHKERFFDDFKDLYHAREQDEKKAEEFANRCLQPAVETYIKESLIPEVIGEIASRKEFTNRMDFQYFVLQDLLLKDEFRDFQEYSSSYEDCIKKWIQKKMETHFSDGTKLLEFEVTSLKQCIKWINEAIKNAQVNKETTKKVFVQNICKELGRELVISQDTVNACMALLKEAAAEKFADFLKKSVKKMEQALQEKQKVTEVNVKLDRLGSLPLNTLTSKFGGCRKQCPFCNAHCEAAADYHDVHRVQIHRPEALGRCRELVSQKLVTSICTDSVNSEVKFCCADTQGKWHPFKDYRTIYKDWEIPADKSFTAADYWIYVMVKYNTEFASSYNAKPADIPHKWRSISKDDADKNLKKAFNK